MTSDSGNLKCTQTIESMAVMCVTECPEGQYMYLCLCTRCESCSAGKMRQGCTGANAGSCIDCSPGTTHVTHTHTHTHTNTHTHKSILLEISEKAQHIQVTLMGPPPLQIVRPCPLDATLAISMLVMVQGARHADLGNIDPRATVLVCLVPKTPFPHLEALLWLTAYANLGLKPIKRTCA